MLREPLLHRIHTLGTALVDRARPVESNYVLRARRHQDLRAGHAGCTDPCHHDFQVFHLLVYDLQSIQQSCQYHHRRPVLIVVEHRNR